MWRLWLVIGWVVWTITIVASATANFLGGYEFGRTPHESYLYGAIGVSADVWKALGPIFIAVLFRQRQHVAAALASLVWVVCFMVAVTAALGLTAKNRAATAGAREGLSTSFERLARDLSEREHRKASLREARSVAETEAAIGTALAQPIQSGTRTLGTVGSLSAECSNVDRRTSVQCAEVASLREELATARERARLDAEISDLREKLAALQRAGGSHAADPQAVVISRLTAGSVPIHEVDFVVAILIVLMIELVSAFTPLVMTEFARAHRSTAATQTDVAACRDQPRVVANGDNASDVGSVSNARTDEVCAFMAARTAPDRSAKVSRERLYASYRAWCVENRLPAAEQHDFLFHFDQICGEELKGSIKKRGSHYVGLKIVSR